MCLCAPPTQLTWCPGLCRRVTHTCNQYDNYIPPSQASSRVWPSSATVFQRRKGGQNQELRCGLSLFLSEQLVWQPECVGCRVCTWRCFPRAALTHVCPFRRSSSGVQRAPQTVGLDTSTVAPARNAMEAGAGAGASDPGAPQTGVGCAAGAGAGTGAGAGAGAGADTAVAGGARVTGGTQTGAGVVPGAAVQRLDSGAGPPVQPGTPRLRLKRRNPSGSDASFKSSQQPSIRTMDSSGSSSSALTSASGRSLFSEGSAESGLVAASQDAPQPAPLEDVYEDDDEDSGPGDERMPPSSAPPAPSTPVSLSWCVAAGLRVHGCHGADTRSRARCCKQADI